MEATQNCICFRSPIAFVYEVEPVNPAKKYELEREVYVANGGDREFFVDFGTWLDRHDNASKMVAKECDRLLTEFAMKHRSFWESQEEFKFKDDNDAESRNQNLMNSIDYAESRE